MVQSGIEVAHDRGALAAALKISTPPTINIAIATNAEIGRQQKTRENQPYWSGWSVWLWRALPSSRRPAHHVALEADLALCCAL